ncbi:MAG: gamma-glutamyltransferase family protein [Rhodospirillales bacterium]|nr:gamma-glutamyltransferase family protein [Rhodospirillales bacterium]
MPATEALPRAMRPTVMGSRHVIAAGHYLSAHAGFSILEAGGNAIDAGVAAGLVTNVVEIELTGIHGIAPIILYRADRNEMSVVAGVGTWPKAATREYFIKNHGGQIKVGGILEAVIPAALDAWVTALEQFGTMSFSEVAAAAIRFASDGFPMYPTLAELIGESVRIGAMGRWPETAEIFMPGGRALKVGEMFVQSDLGRSLQFLADEEKSASKRGRAAGLQAVRDAFYRGDIAKKMADFHKENGGLVTRDDLANFKVAVEPAVSTRFRDIDVYSCGPWCQGPTLLQALNMLEGLDLESMGHNSPAYIHALTEAIKLSISDREAYYGDPNHVDVPLETLLSKEYGKQRASQIRPDKAWPEMPPAGAISGRKPWTAAGGVGEGKRSPDFESSLATSYIAVVDRHGNAFSATPTDGLMGCPVVPGTGIGTSMSGRPFWVDDRPAALAPGKRPRTQCSPAIAIRPGKQLMPFGTPGADVIMQAMLQAFMNVFVFGMDPQLAVEAPRFATYSFPETFLPHDYKPGLLKIEETIAKPTGEALARMGHKVEWWPSRFWQIGNVSAVLADLKTGVRHGGSDHRRAGYAIGW